MAHYKMSDVAVEVNDRENNPANSQYERFVGLEHYVSGEVIIRNYGSTQNLESTMKIFQSGDVLVARRNVYLKRAATVDFDGLTSGDSIVLRSKNPVIGRILPFVLNTDAFWDFADQYSDGTMSKRLSPKTLMTYEFDLPNEDELESFADLLWAANDARESYQELLRQTDELVKSQFIELFGDPINNPKEWPVFTLKELTTKLGSGATPKGGNASYKEEGISLIRSMHVYNGYFDYEDLAYIDDEQARKLDNVIVEDEDVLLNITGASVARCCIVPSDLLPARVNQHVCIIRCKQDLILPVFLNNLLIGNEYQMLLWDMAEAAGATRQALTKEQIENLKIIVPAICDQEQFVAIVKQTDKSKYCKQNHIFSMVRGGELCA